MKESHIIFASIKTITASKVRYPYKFWPINVTESHFSHSKLAKKFSYTLWSLNISKDLRVKAKGKCYKKKIYQRIPNFTWLYIRMGDVLELYEIKTMWNLGQLPKQMREPVYIQWKYSLLNHCYLNLCSNLQWVDQSTTYELTSTYSNYVQSSEIKKVVHSTTALLNHSLLHTKLSHWLRLISLFTFAPSLQNTSKAHHQPLFTVQPIWNTLNL